MTTIFSEGKLKPAVQGEKIADTTDLDGTFVKAFNDAGTQATQQDADGNEETVDLSAGLSDTDRHDLNAVPGLEAKTADLEVEVLARSWGDVAALADGGFSHADSRLGPSHAAALVYVIASVPTPDDADDGYVYIRIPEGRSSRDYRIRQHRSPDEFFITSWDHAGDHEGFKYYRSRHNLFGNYNVTIQYDAVTAAQTDFRGRTLARKSQVDSSGFDGQLANTDDTVQKVAQKFDDLDIEAGASVYDGHGAPPAPPAHVGDLEVNHTGRLWAAGDEQISHTVAPSWSSDPTLITTATWANWRGATRLTSTPTADGYFHYAGLARRWILRDEDGTVHRYDRWMDVLEFYYDNIDLQNSPPAGLLGSVADPSIFITGDHVAFGSLADAAAHVAAAQLDADEVYVFFVGSPDDYDNWQLHYAAADTFTAGMTTITEELHWRGPLLLQEDVEDDVRVLSDDLPQNVGETASAGVSNEVLRADAAPALPIGDTLRWDGASLAVNIHDVIEHVGEHVRYYTNDATFPQPGGHSAGERFRTSQYQKTITKVQGEINPSTDAEHYVARIKEVDDDNHIIADLGTSQRVRVATSNHHHDYRFENSEGDVGIPIPHGKNIVIIFDAVEGGEPLVRRGDPANGSPEKSYDDADEDFERVQSVVYTDGNPSVGDGTHSHDSSTVRGNIKIFYNRTFDRGNVVGNAGTTAGRVAGILDVTDQDAWVLDEEYADTTPLIGVDRSGRYMSWFDGALYLGDASGDINSRDTGVAMSGMARGPGFFVTGEGNMLVSRRATDLAVLHSASHGLRHTVAVQQDDPTKFWSLSHLTTGEVTVLEAGVSAAGVFAADSVRHTVTVASLNNALGNRYINVSGLYDSDSDVGLIDLHVESAAEIWLLFGEIPLTLDNTQTRIGHAQDGARQRQQLVSAHRRSRKNSPMATVVASCG